jgi:hypothetical protein
MVPLFFDMKTNVTRPPVISFEPFSLAVLWQTSSPFLLPLSFPYAMAEHERANNN